MQEDGKTEVKEITVPANALTTCPIRRYGQVSVQGCCVACPNFRGLYDVVGPAADAVEVSFAQRYRVQCGVPQVREIAMFDIGDKTE